MCVVFIKVCLRLSSIGGNVGMINHHNWMFNNSYDNFRKETLRQVSLDSLLHLGSGAFQDQGGEVVQAVTFAARLSAPKSSKKGVYYRLVDNRNTQTKQ